MYLEIREGLKVIFEVKKKKQTQKKTVERGCLAGREVKKQQRMGRGS